MRGTDIGLVERLRVAIRKRVKLPVVDVEL